MVKGKGSKELSGSDPPAMTEFGHSHVHVLWQARHYVINERLLASSFSIETVLAISTKLFAV